MARKAWNELSPSYRTRLQRRGITEKMHSNPNVTLKSARGHGVHTKSEMTKESKRNKNIPASHRKLIEKGMQQKIEPTNTRRMIDLYGTRFTSLLIKYKEYRHQQYVKGVKADAITDFRQWVIDNGYVWDDDYDIYMDSLDYDNPFIRYH